MNFETISLLLNWLQMGVLLAILFRLSHTFELIANTQRELRRAVNRLGERYPADQSVATASETPVIPQRARVPYMSWSPRMKQ
jgi:hypothetical protein